MTDWEVIFFCEIGPNYVVLICSARSYAPQLGYLSLVGFENFWFDTLWF
jgi:hypothetical protein